MLLPDWIVLALSVAGVSLFILGARRWGIVLLTPAALRWLIWPLIVPYFYQVIPHDASGIALGAVLLSAILVFGGIWLLARIVSVIYGQRAGANVASEYLVRTFDGIARASAWLLISLFSAIRAIFRRLRR